MILEDVAKLGVTAAAAKHGVIRFSVHDWRKRVSKAQRVGDGMQVTVVVDGQRFNFNLELNVDAHSGALVGASVRREDDSAAVVEAFNDAVLTTGKQPIALLLDNRPSGLTPKVLAALDDTMLIRATLGRGQKKGHVEGAFGLSSQILPKLSLDTRLGHVALAGAFLGVVAQVWARTTKHRPRGGRGCRSRVDMYGDKPSDAQLQSHGGPALSPPSRA